MGYHPKGYEEFFKDPVRLPILVGICTFLHTKYQKKGALKFNILGIGTPPGLPCKVRAK